MYLFLFRSGLLNLRELDPAVDRLQLDPVAAAVDLSAEGAADEMAVDLQAEIVVDAAVDRLALDLESRFAVEFDVDGAVDRGYAQVAAEQRLLDDLDGAVNRFEGPGLELALKIDLAVHGLQHQVRELSRTVDLAVDRFEHGLGELFRDGYGEIDLGLGIFLVVLGIDLQGVLVGLKDDFHVLDLALVVGLFHDLDVHGPAGGGGDFDLAVDVGQFDAAGGG